MNTTQAAQTIDRALMLAEMAASLAVRLSQVNALLANVQRAHRQPTDAEFQSVYDGYDQARSKLLADADLIDKVNGAASATPAA